MDARLQLAEHLAAELKRHGLARHLDQLRAYYVATRAGRAAPWGDSHVAHLARVFQVSSAPAPALEVRPAGSTCCPGFLARTVVNVADRYLVSCAGCERRWLVLLPAA